MGNWVHCTNDTTGVCGVGWEYTPQDQVDTIQRKVLSVLEELYRVRSEVSLQIARIATYVLMSSNIICTHQHVCIVFNLIVVDHCR